MDERKVLDHERANLLDAIAELEADIRDDKRRERECRAESESYRTYSAPSWNPNRGHEQQAYADAAAVRITQQRVRLSLRRQWLRGIERRIAKLAA